MVKALRLQLQAWGSRETAAAARAETSEEPESGATREQAFLALERANYQKLERLRAALAALDVPASATVAPSISAEADWIWAEVERLTQVSARHSLSARARTWLRWRRVIVLGSLPLFVLLISFRLWGRPRVQASAVYAADFPAANAIDGLEATEWLLPDDTAGSIDVMFPHARTVHRVRLLNAHNRSSADRAARAVRVTAFSNSGPSVSAKGAFKHFSEERSVLELEIEAENVTRVRVQVLSHFASGGGLAEIEVE
ncbi:MAG: hypothetical protein ABW061_28925 [Polyangiaceae bacterium]